MWNIKKKNTIKKKYKTLQKYCVLHLWAVKKEKKRSSASINGCCTSAVRQKRTTKKHVGSNPGAWRELLKMLITRKVQENQSAKSAR